MANLKIQMKTKMEKFKILTEFIEHKKISRNYFLEQIFKINKDAETKTIESHLTRIRKKLNKINSEIQISLKENIFYLEDQFGYGFIRE